MSVDYQINFSEPILSNLSRVMSFCSFGHFKIVSKVSKKLFELGA